MSFTFQTMNPAIDIGYSGDGRKIVRDFYIPVLQRSVAYYRLSGYFSLESLTVTAGGLAGLIQNGGHMKLVVGAHDLGAELREAHSLTTHHAQELLDEIGSRIATDMDTLVDVFSQERLRALAWMLVNNSLEIRVAIPKKTYYDGGSGIFHEKLLIMEDKEGCTISATGSANETLAAYAVNGERLTLHMSWREGADAYINKYKSDFNAIWTNNHPDYLVFALPEAIKLKLRERFYSVEPPKYDPAEKESIEALSDNHRRILPIAHFIQEWGSLQGYSHLGLGPVLLYPHQKYTSDFVLSRFPHRCLLADEVGLGKTLEGGAIIKQLFQEHRIERVLLLSPKNVARQWMEELYTHFGLKFRLFESSPQHRFIDMEGGEIRLGSGQNPFSYAGVDAMIMSWHYARRDDVKKMLLSAPRGFDLIVVDEAHAARKKRINNRNPEPTKMNELCMELGISCPHMLLLTATPVQMRSEEALDLLRILGLGGRWVNENNFRRFYEILMKSDENIEEDEWTFGLQMVQSFAGAMLPRENVDDLILSCVPPEYCDETVRMMHTGENFGSVVSRLKNVKEMLPFPSVYIHELPRETTVLRKLLTIFSPLQWYMVRNTRSKLQEQGFKFPHRQINEVDVELSPHHVALLEQLDEYLYNQYGKYERIVRKENRGTIGFVRCIYHQRFVSSFSAAYQTITHRLEFLDALLHRDYDTMLNVAERIFSEDMDDETDEFAFVQAMQDMLEKPDVKGLIGAEHQTLQGLQTALADYAPPHVPLDDPKLSVIYDVVSRLYRSEGRKVLVFSKYTDTIDAIHRLFLERGYGKGEVALYTGAGGRVYDSGINDYRTVSKEEVRKALETTDLGVVLCTDAASEGLNLQAASALVNVDMPWNPARVEQRIGRVDRLGQVSLDVRVVNVWYPESIEANMYGALFSRSELYQIVVGPAQEKFGQSLREAFDQKRRGECLKEFTSDAIEKIERVKEDVARSAGVFSGRQWDGTEVDDDAVVERTAEFVRIAAEHLGLGTTEQDGRLYLIAGRCGVPAEMEAWNGASLYRGMANTLTPGHPLVQWLAAEMVRIGEEEGSSAVFSESYYVVKDGRRIGTLYRSGEDGGGFQKVNGSEVIGVADRLLAHARGDE